MATKKPQRPASKVQQPSGKAQQPAAENATGALPETPDAPTAPGQQPGTEVQPPAAENATGAPPETPPETPVQKPALGLCRVCTVKVPGGKRFRAGIQFGVEPVEVDFAELADDQIAAITSDPHLKVTPA